MKWILLTLFLVGCGGSDNRFYHSYSRIQDFNECYKANRLTGKGDKQSRSYCYKRIQQYYNQLEYMRDRERYDRWIR